MAVSRQHPFFSRIGCLGGLVLILGIVVAVVLSGGAIFSPGALTARAEAGKPLQGFAAHADFENDCRQCHVPLQGIGPERCENCHADVRAEREAETGLHGKLKPEEAARCETCHLDHRGRDLNPNETALKKFDHSMMGFRLARHITNYDHSPLDCKGCHIGVAFKLDTITCVKCHGDHDATFMLQHTRAFGQECLTCHDGADQMTGFDHAKTRFALQGRHAALDCAACHKPEVAAQNTPTECAACHAEPPIHSGVFGTDCAACHTPTAWTPARLNDQPAFRHANTAIQLINHTQNYDGSPFTCRTCHTDEGFTFTAQTCTTCHTAHNAVFMTQHVQAYGSNCLRSLVKIT